MRLKESYKEEMKGSKDERSITLEYLASFPYSLKTLSQKKNKKKKHGLQIATYFILIQEKRGANIY